MTTDSVTGQVLADSTLLRYPAAVSATAKYIAVADNGADSLLTVFDATTHNFAGAVGDPRTGLVKRAWAWSVEPSADVPDGFSVYDPVQRKSITIGVGPSAGVRRVDTVAASHSILQPMRIAGGGFFGIGLRLPTRFGLFAPSGRLLRALGPAPEGADSLPIFIRQHAAQAEGALSPARDRIALAYRYTDRLEVYDTAGRLLVRAVRPVGFDPVYDVGQRAGAPAVGMRDDSRIAYVSLAADSTRLYGLFSGRAIGAYHGRAFAGAAVHVYRWDGTLERVLRLPRDAARIGVAPDGRSLYAVEVAPHAALVAYALTSVPGRVWASTAGRRAREGAP